MEQLNVSGATGEQLAKRMLKLAWDAAAVVGSGFLQDRGPKMTEDQLWERGCDNFNRNTHKDGDGNIYADYLFGRMMKLGFWYGRSHVGAHTREWRADYQSFCRRYPNFKALAEAAAKELGATLTVAESLPV